MKPEAWLKRVMVRRAPSEAAAPIGELREITEDDQGLYVMVRLNDSEAAESIRRSIKGIYE